MKLLLKNLKQYAPISKAYIHSFEGALYQLRIEINGEQTLVWQDKKTPLKRRNLTEMKALLSDIPIQNLYLYQESAYDEMLGQASKKNSNAMVLGLSTELSVNC